MGKYNTRGNMIRRAAQMLSYIADHKAGFYRRDMCKEIEIGEEPSRRWLAIMEEEGLVWRWRRFRNDAWLWRGTFVLRKQSRETQPRRAA